MSSPLNRLWQRARKARRSSASGRARASVGRIVMESLEPRCLLAALAVGPNVDLTRDAVNQSETSIAINPTNPLNMAASANENDVVGMFLGISNDGGKTWTSKIVANGNDSFTSACCDTTVAYDAFGNLFLSYLDSTDSKAELYMSADSGLTFTKVGEVGSHDQPKIATGPGNQAGTQSVWMEYLDSNDFIAGVGANTTGLGTIGQLSAVQEVPNTLGNNFGKLSVGPKGQVLMSFQDNTGTQGPATIFVSLDALGVGGTFTPAVVATKTNVGGFDYITPQGARSIDAEAGLAYDNSGGPFNGRVYLVYTDAAAPGAASSSGPFTAAGNNTVIALRHSDDDGLTWSSPVKVNDDFTLLSKFFPRVAVDQTDGNVGLSWYDCRNDPGSGPGDTNGVADQSMEVFATVSSDGGLSFLPNVQVSAGPSDAQIVAGQNSFNDFGDYSGLAFYNNKLYPIWADNSKALPGNPNVPNLDVATAEVDVQALQVTPILVPVKEGVPFSGVIANINAVGTNLTAGSFAASINWGDGTASAGVIALNPSGGFTVSGNHTYPEGGQYPLSISVSQSGGVPTVARETLTVTDASLTGQGLPISIVEGTFTSTVNGGVLAHFFDSDLNPTTPSDYAASINWGDGTASPGVITVDPVAGFDVTASHLYGAGTFPVVVTVSDIGGATVAIGVPTTVADLPLHSATDLQQIPVEGQVFTGTVASFVDDDTRLLPASNYRATIDYGDGTTAAGIIQPSSFGGYTVSANHVFNAGSDTITVTVTDIGGATTSVTQTISVGDATLQATPVNFTTPEGVPYTSFIARFIDGDPRPHPGVDYGISINWGDGSPVDTTSGKVIPDGQGGYLVFGKHAFEDSPTPYKITVTITDEISQSSQSSITPATIPVTIHATITDAPLRSTGVLSIAPTPGVAGNFVVANFTDDNTIAQPSDFTATITWGDGNTSAGTITASPGGGFTVSGSNAYAQKGTYAVSVSIDDVGGASTSASATAVVPEAPITAQGLVITTAQRSLFTGVVATFTDSNPQLTATDFAAEIVWGDGTIDAGTISADGAGGFAVNGSHAYLLSGTFTATVQVTSVGGGLAIAQSAAVVAPVLPSVTGGLSTQLGTGNPPVPGVTNQSSPSFTGVSLPGATVHLFGVPVGGGSMIALGSGRVAANGTWSILSTHLADGAYAVVAQATDVQNESSPLAVLLPTASTGPLVVDTQGPKVSSVFLEPRTGIFHIVIADGLSGVNRAGLLNGANYSLQIVTKSGALQSVGLTGLTLSPGGPQGPQTILASFATGKKLKPGGYVLTINSAGITDLAGNVLDERFFVPFPALYNTPGQNFVAQINVSTRGASPPQQYIPPSEVIAAAADRSLVRNIFRPRRRR
jgi:hypothetical protein